MGAVVMKGSPVVVVADKPAGAFSKTERVLKKAFESESVMNLHRILILGAAVGALAACSGDNTAPKLVTPGPAALLHIVNAVPDTGALDFRFTDVVEGVPNVEFVNLPFRGGT